MPPLPPPQPRRAPLLAPLLLLWLLGAALPCCGAIPYVQDELLWTKKGWQEYKLPFPWAGAVKERDAESTRQLQGPLAGFQLNSLNGPLLDGAVVEQLVKDDATRPPMGVPQASNLDISLLDEAASQEAAAGVAQCKVCGSLVKHLWSGLTHWVNRQRQVPNKKHIAAYAADLCDFEVPNNVLKGWVLLRARVQQEAAPPLPAEGGVAAPAPPEHEGTEFYLLSQRAQQHATPTEIEAVRKSCQALLREDGVGADQKRNILHLTSTMLHQYYRHLAKRLHPQAAGSVWEAVEAVDDGPSAQRACIDRHPQCQMWKEKGECESNASYMLGEEGKANGWCRPACGACAHEEPPHGLTAEDAAKMREVASASLAVLQSQACLSAAPCKWATGGGMKELLDKTRQGVVASNPEAVGLMENAAYITGPVMSRQQQLQAALDKERLKDTKPMLTRPLSEAIVPDKQLGRVTNRKDVAETVYEAAKLLARELGDKCLYVNTGWWMYQLCYRRHITQFHMTDKLEVDWVISLGHFESANWTADVATGTGIYPHGFKVPYVSQAYGEGNHCELDATDSSGAKRAILRRTELRVMCSPDADAHITVTEPQQCVYLVELYVPQLCRVEGFEVELPPGLAAELDASWNGQGGSGTVAASGTASGGGGGGAAGGAVLQAAGRHEEDDPYDDREEEGSDVADMLHEV